VSKVTSARIVLTHSVDRGCGILLQHEGWPSVYLELVLKLVEGKGAGQYLAQLEAIGGFGILAKGLLPLDRADFFYSDPLHCIGQPNSRLVIRPQGKRTWGEVKICKDIDLKVEAVKSLIQGPDAKSVGGT
jgi:hypothetical protein